MKLFVIWSSYDCNCNFETIMFTKYVNYTDCIRVLLQAGVTKLDAIIIPCLSRRLLSFSWRNVLPQSEVRQVVNPGGCLEGLLLVGVVAHALVSDCFGSPPVRWGLLDFMPADPPPARCLPSSFRLLQSPDQRVSDCSLPDLNRKLLSEVECRKRKSDDMRIYARYSVTMLDRMSETTPERMSENMADRMPECILDRTAIAPDLFLFPGRAQPQAIAVFPAGPQLEVFAQIYMCHCGACRDHSKQNHLLLLFKFITMTGFIVYPFILVHVLCESACSVCMRSFVDVQIARLCLFDLKLYIKCI